jgi:hypothetical protein
VYNGAENSSLFMVDESKIDMIKHFPYKSGLHFSTKAKISVGSKRRIAFYLASTPVPRADRRRKPVFVTNDIEARKEFVWHPALPGDDSEHCLERGPRRTRQSRQGRAVPARGNGPLG